MYSAKALSEKIRMKRKSMQSGIDSEVIDTAPKPLMNPQDILNNKQKAQMEDTMDLPEKSEAPSDPADEDIEGTSQSISTLEKRMSRVKRMFDKMK